MYSEAIYLFFVKVGNKCGSPFLSTKSQKRFDFAPYTALKYFGILYFPNFTHTCIDNSNILGETRFVTNGTPKYSSNGRNNCTVKITET